MQIFFYHFVVMSWVRNSQHSAQMILLTNNKMITRKYLQNNSSISLEWWLQQKTGILEQSWQGNLGIIELAWVQKVMRTKLSKTNTCLKVWVKSFAWNPWQHTNICLKWERISRHAFQALIRSMHYIKNVLLSTYTTIPWF